MGVTKRVIEKDMFFGAKAELFDLAVLMRKKGVKNHDEGRTGELERFGIKVLRFTNQEVLGDSPFYNGTYC